MKHSRFVQCLALMAASTLPWIIGCSTDNGLNLARVHGKVTFKGEPVKKGTVFFFPDASKGTVGPSGVGGLSGDGSYVASTETAGDGVIVGSHKIGLSGLEAASAADLAASAEVEKDGAAYIQAKAKAATGRGPRNRRADLFTDAGGKKWRYIVPKKLSDPDQSGVAVKIEPGSNRFNFDIGEDGQVKVSQ